MRGNVFNIQRFSIHDGPGVRSVIFFQGCNLHCRWCHNPESILHRPKPLYYAEHCTGCGACVAHCPTGAHYFSQTGTHIYLRANCTRCLRCVDHCVWDALTVSGEKVDAAEVEARLEDEKPYYGAEGGITFSGGECMLQIDFLDDLLGRFGAQGVHCAVDTAGCVPWASFKRILGKTGLFLYDLKAADPEVHKALTGVDNRLIVENLRRLSRAGARIWVRVPLVPGANDGEMAGIAALCAGLRLERIELMPYHRLGESKYPAMGNDLPAFSPPTGNDIQAARRHFEGLPLV